MFIYLGFRGFMVKDKTTSNLKEFHTHLEIQDPYQTQIHCHQNLVLEENNFNQRNNKINNLHSYMGIPLYFSIIHEKNEELFAGIPAPDVGLAIREQWSLIK